MSKKKIEQILIAAAALVLIGLGAWFGVPASRAAGPATTPRSAGPEATAPLPSASADGEVVAFRGVRLFDGERVVPSATVVIENGLVTAAGPDVAIPAGAEVVDGHGRTLLPGLIDAHTHVFGDALERALVFGVTTELDMFTDHGMAARLRREQAEGPVPDRADLFSAGTLITAPGGHGSQFGMEIPTLERPEDADAFVAARIAEGSDYIKIVSEDGEVIGRPIPTLDRATVAAVIVAAHRHGKLAVVHATTRQRASEALADGADGLVHIFGDRPIDEELAALAAGSARRGAPAGDRDSAGTRPRPFVIPTLSVVASMAGEPDPALAADPRLAGFLTVAEAASLERSFPPRDTVELALAQATVARLRHAGVPILAGTDAPNPGTAHGVSMHRELALLVDAGLSPVDALAAATSRPADAFGLADRGRIAPGRRADLLLVEGDPTQQITASRAIVGVWKGGAAVDRRPQRDADQVASAGERPRLDPGPLADFDDLATGPAPQQIAAGPGFGWTVSDDRMAGGASTVQLSGIAGGAEGSAGALAIEGEIRAGFPFPWAGAIYFPGAAPMAPVDLSGAERLVFYAHGEGGPFRLMLFAESQGRMPAERPFEAPADGWQRIELPLADFGVDLSGVTALHFSGPAEPGAFRLAIDQVALE